MTRPFDLQLFAQERTEEATPRRRRKVRERGQVFRSTEVNSVAVLLSGALALKALAGYSSATFEGMVRSFLGMVGAGLTPATIGAIARQAAYYTAALALPVAGLVFVASLAVNYFQVGFLLTGQPLVPDLKRLNPVEGFKRIFSGRALVELLKSLAKLAIVAAVVYRAVMANLPALPDLMREEVVVGGRAVADMAFGVVLQAALALLVLAFFDYQYQRYEYDKSIRMTKKEVKDELKETEGDPLIRQKVREYQRRLARGRMMADVARADVVITNPTHFAVALLYDPASMAAPRLVAKGRGYLARRIRSIAEENGVAVVEDPPLCRALYAGAEVGDPVPPELYRAVAEVLAFVYRLKGKA